MSELCSNLVRLAAAAIVVTIATTGWGAVGAAAAAGPDGSSVEAVATLTPALDSIVQRALNDPWAYERLGELCDHVGARLTGSEGMRRASAWAATTMTEAGFDSVWTEPVTVPVWERGREWARCTDPVPFDLDMLGLGQSDGTGPGGIEAEVLAVRDFEELEARAAEAAGKIVLFDPPWEGYGKTVRYRGDGASAAARHGAVACLIRSVTDSSLATPHTGMMRYDETAPRIPVAAITVEDAGRLRRLADAGLKPRVRLMMEARNLGDGPCLNTLGDVRGREQPDQIVLVAGHLDAWDTGTGAHDDGAGCLIALAAVRLLKDLDLVPRRTLRVVLYTAEEIGGHGGRAYRDLHAGELPRHVLALESDSGAFAPRGFGVRASEPVLAHLQEIGAVISPLLAPHLERSEALEIEQGWAGVDIQPVVEEGVPGVGHRVHGDRYFHYHHSPADTFDKIDPAHLAQNVAAVAALIYAVAEAPQSLRDLAVPPAPGGSTH
ncbi:MAG: M20/M25/M40 family metallo-hydrolase [Candidatus Krumholzibacteriia bacterium]